MSKEQLFAILEQASKNPPPQNSIEDLRNWFEEINSRFPLAESVDILPHKLGEVIVPPKYDAEKLIIYIHGGGFVFGSAKSHRVNTTNLAALTGYRVLSINYRMAPEVSAPISHDDCYNSYIEALEEFNPKKIALCGDSAGGNLAVMTALRAKHECKRIPDALFLLSPALDFAGDLPSHEEIKDDPILNPQILELFNSLYIPNKDYKSSRITPLYEDMANMPATLIHVGSWEVLRDDAVTLANNMKVSGVNASVKIWDGMVHEWQLYLPILDEAKQSIEEGARFLVAECTDQ